MCDHIESTYGGCDCIDLTIYIGRDHIGFKKSYGVNDKSYQNIKAMRGHARNLHDIDAVVGYHCVN